MSGQVGMVTAVQSERRGVIATSWVGTVMSVVNAADLDREGGLLSPDGGVTLYTYTGVADGATDDAPDTVTMADAAPDGWPTDTTDPETGDVIPAEVRLDCWPERLDVVAMVDLGDGETIPAVVPHALRPLLVDGDRETGAGESVQLARVAGVWTISDVPGKRAVIEGTTIATPSLSALPRTQISGSTLEVVRSDGEDGEIVTTSLGGDDGDHLQLSDDGVNPSVSFDSGGSGVVDTLTVNTAFNIGGSDLIADIIGPLPKGIVSAYNFRSFSATIGNNECGIVDIAFDAEPRRTYRIVFDGYVYTSDPARFQMYFRARSDGDGRTSPPPTFTVSALWGSGIFFNPDPAGGLIRVHLERTIVANTDYSNTSQYRVLLSMNTLTSGTAAQVHPAWKSQLYVEDVGMYTGSWNDAVANNGGGSPTSGTIQDPPAASVKTYTSSWAMDAWRAWRGSGTVSNYLQQGYYGGYQRYSVLLWGSNPSSAMSGYKNITGMWLYIKNASWYSFAGGTLRLGHYNSTALPGSPQKSGGSAVSVAMKPGQGLWIGLPSGWWHDIAAGNIRGFTLGEGANTSGTYYGKFQPSGVVLKATYSK